MVVHGVLLVVLLSQHRARPLFSPNSGILTDRDTIATMSLPSVRRPIATVPRHSLPRSAAAPVAAPVVVPQHLPAPTDVVALQVPTTVVDSPPLSGALQPHYGTGRLWVEPLTETPRRIARTLTGKTDAQLDDSAVTAMVQAYLNQMAVEQRDHPESLPSWTTKIGGKMVGIDQRWIYLGPLKVPTALLALLPIKVQANPTEAEYNARLQQMRSDLMEAARRSATYDDFKEAVKELHAESERQRQFKKNQSTPPASKPE